MAPAKVGAIFLSPPAECRTPAGRNAPTQPKAHADVARRCNTRKKDPGMGVNVKPR